MASSGMWKRGTGVGIARVDEGCGVMAMRVGARVGRRGFRGRGGIVGIGDGVSVGVGVGVWVGVCVGVSVGVGHGVRVAVGVHVGGRGVCVGRSAVGEGEGGAEVMEVTGNAATVAGAGNDEVHAM